MKDRNSEMLEFVQGFLQANKLVNRYGNGVNHFKSETTNESIPTSGEDELLAKIERVVKSQLQAQMEEILKEIAKFHNHQTVQRKHLTLKEAAEYTGLSESYLYKLCSRQEVPFWKRGKRNFFQKESLDGWLLAHRIKTTEEIQADANNFINNGRNDYGW